MFDLYIYFDYFDDFVLVWGELGLIGMVCIGVSVEYVCNVVVLVEQFGDVWVIVGLYFGDVEEDLLDICVVIEVLLDYFCVVGIGESGLDDYWNDIQCFVQFVVFEWQLEFVWCSGKFLVIYICDKLGQDLVYWGVIEILRDWFDVQVIFYCFIGYVGLLVCGLECGVYFGFVGNVIYKNVVEIQVVVQQVLLDWLLVEIDVFFLVLVFKWGKFNWFGYVCYMLDFVVGLCGLNLVELECVIDENVWWVYGI